MICQNCINRGPDLFFVIFWLMTNIKAAFSFSRFILWLGMTQPFFLFSCFSFQTIAESFPAGAPPLLLLLQCRCKNSPSSASVCVFGCVTCFGDKSVFPNFIYLLIIVYFCTKQLQRDDCCSLWLQVKYTCSFHQFTSVIAEDVKWLFFRQPDHKRYLFFWVTCNE